MVILGELGAGVLLLSDFGPAAAGPRVRAPPAPDGRHWPLLLRACARRVVPYLRAVPRPPAVKNLRVRVYLLLRRLSVSTGLRAAV